LGKSTSESIEKLVIPKCPGVCGPKRESVEKEGPENCGSRDAIKNTLSQAGTGGERGPGDI